MTTSDLGTIRDQIRQEIRDGLQGFQDSAEKGAEIEGRFPDLKDKSSDMFAKTKLYYKAILDRAPDRKDDPTAIFDAAEKAELALGGAKYPGPSKGERAAAQSGAGGRLSIDPMMDALNSDDDNIDADAEQLLSALKGQGVTAKTLVAERKAMRGLM